MLPVALYSSCDFVALPPVTDQSEALCVLLLVSRNENNHCHLQLVCEGLGNKHDKND